MTDGEIEQAVKQALYEVAPDIAGEPIEPDEAFREQFEIDSMDFLNFIIALNQATGVEIPEKDYPSLQSLSGAVDYLKRRLG